MRQQETEAGFSFSSGNLTVANSTLSQKSAPTGAGGDIYNAGGGTLI